MPGYPLPYTTQAYCGSQWQVSFQFFQSDGQTLLPIVGNTYELVVRTSTDDVSATPALVVNSSTSTASGTITINTGTSTITATLTPSATLSLIAGETYAVTGWSNTGTTTASVFVSGNLYAVPVAAAV
jgi:hypothetical protein